MAKPEEKTILVVDDEPDVRDYLSIVLEDVGFNVVTAVDGMDALEKMEQIRPDFISLDLVMPRKSGIKFLRELRRNRDWARIPVVIVTAHAHDDLGRQDYEDIFAGKSLTGPHIALEKPVNPEAYVRLVCERLDVPYELDEAGAGEERLRGELASLIKGADKSQLAEMMKLLKKKNQG